jgi:hypothetical protein
MRFLLLSILMVSFSVHAQETELSFKNVREGKSFYTKFIHNYAVKRVLKKTTRAEILAIYQDALKKQNPKKLCAYELNNEISTALQANSTEIDLKGFIYVVRQENEIDDVVAKVLLTAHKVQTTTFMNKDEDDIIPPANDEKTKSALDLIASFDKRFASKACFDDAYRNFYSEFTKIDKKYKSYQLEALNLKAFQERRISEAQYLALEQGRINELEGSSLSLASYQQKINTLRIQYPLRDLTEKSDFTSIKVKKMKSSRRQKLFENYTDMQIILMGNVIKELRASLEDDKVVISSYKEGELRKEVALDPMERFRYAIKTLRKSMTLLSLNTFFNGRSPDYMDLMIASYEIGVIPASEMEVVVSLEEIWNPKKTFWDKAGVWIKVFSSVATIVIPPPYGFIPALVILVIEATVGKKKQPNTNDPSVLF